MKASALGLVLLVTAAPLARAQSLGVDVEGGYRTLNASDSASAVFGSSGGLTLGGSAQYALRRGLLFRGGFRHFGKDGERVFLGNTSSPPVPLGFPLKANLNSIDLIAGWRFASSGKKPSRLVPYVGLGAEIAAYREETTVGGLLETNENTKVGAQVVAGLEFALAGSWSLAAEAGYSMVPDAIGVGGVSQVYGEDDVGGFRIVGRIGYRFSLK